MGAKARDKVQSGVVVLWGRSDGKISLIVRDSEDMVKKGIHAGNIMKEIAPVVGGKGGGKPNMAKAGGSDISQIPAAIDKARAGMLLGDLGEIIQNEAGQSGYRIIEELCGHGVGRRTHEAPEVPNFHDKDNPGLLRIGLVIAIEPIISAGNGSIRHLDDGWTIATADGAWAAHYEETVIVWDHGLEVVTAAP